MTKRVLNNRYEVLRELGRGAQAVTLMAGDIQTQTPVAIKELRWDAIEDWKAHELFQRETAALRALSHPGIPAFIDAFEEDGAYYLVQEMIQGKNLKDLGEAGHVWTTGALKRLFVEVLDTLEYLHGHSPPVVHRDVKPSNIILYPDRSYAVGHETEGDGTRFVLVDFGAVQLTVQTDTGGSTVIGTPGYMPIEQLQGQAVPATDLYALGATIVAVATGISPNELPIERGKIQFEHRVSLPPRFLAALNACLEPMVEDRPASVADVRTLLTLGPSELVQSPQSDMTVVRSNTDAVVRLVVLVALVLTTLCVVLLLLLIG